MVSLPRLDALVTSMATFDAQVEAQIRDLESQMSCLHASWQGEAADAQQQTYAELHAGLAQMRAALVSLRSATAVAHANYAAAVDANQRMFGTLG